MFKLFALFAVAETADCLRVWIAGDAMVAVALDATGDAGKATLRQVLIEAGHIHLKGVGMTPGAVDSGQAFGVGKIGDALQRGMAVGAGETGVDGAVHHRLVDEKRLGDAASDPRSRRIVVAEGAVVLGECRGSDDDGRQN